MITVQLHDLQFHAYHGIHEEEKILGNDYLVNCSLQFYESAPVIRHIDETINYAFIYEVIKARMSTPTPLLETVAMEIGNQIVKKYKDLKSIDVSIKKKYPPIESICGSVGVTWHKIF